MTLGLLILLLVFLAFFHFVVDGIVAPSEHMLSRMALLKVGDDVKAAKKIKGKDRDEALSMLSKSAYGLINHLPRYNVWTFASVAVKLKQDAKFKQDVVARVKRLDRAQDQDIVDIRRDIEKQADRIFVWNAMSWTYLIVPIGMTLTCLGFVKKIITASITMPQSSAERCEFNHIESAA